MPSVKTYQKGSGPASTGPVAAPGPPFLFVPGGIRKVANSGPRLGRGVLSTVVGGIGSVYSSRTEGRIWSEPDFG